MIQPTVTVEGITFVNANAMSKLYPETFGVPSKYELNNIKEGTYVKVSAFNERFWTIVQKVDGDMITAVVDNDLLTDKLKLGDVIEYPKDCIYSIL